MKCFPIAVGVALFYLALAPRQAIAGMPSADLTDLGAMRFEAISFFAFGLILSAAFIQALWNWLRQDFPRMPRLSYGKACAIVGLWGLLFVIVLTMISGARELMTPGAWEKNGATYKLAKSETIASEAEADLPPGKAEKDNLLTSRRLKMHELSQALREYAVAHDGNFPNDISSSGIDGECWQLPGKVSMQYQYVPGATMSAKEFLVVYEPNIFDDQPLALYADGRIVAMDIDDILNSLPRGDVQ